MAVFPFKRVAESLETLLAQINAMAPGRGKLSDGALGDDAHQHTVSDHNPDANGIVTARDFTHDPAHGMDAGEIAERLRLSQDSRIKYVISNRRIFSSKNSPWVWRPYNGANAHTQHVHVSVMDNPALYDDTRPWSIERRVTVSEPMQGSSATRFSNITATMFGGRLDPNKSAYDEHMITDDELGVALPLHFQGARPKVRVINTSSNKSVVCDIVDVGPWNTNDPYWTSGSRPQAESGVDLRGRPTNLAGIDLTPAAARAIGIPGKGKVDWEFASAVETGDGTMPTPVNNVAALLQQVLTVLQALQKQQPAATGQPQTQQADQVQKVIEIINSIVNPSAAGAPPLGQVNGAFGQTIGNLLDGKKTAIGTIGALATTLLSQVPGGSGLGQVLSLVTPAAGLSGIAMPIFLAIGVWGFLGKMEKWAQGTAPPPKK